MTLTMCPNQNLKLNYFFNVYFFFHIKQKLFLENLGFQVVMCVQKFYITFKRKRYASIKCVPRRKHAKFKDIANYKLVFILSQLVWLQQKRKHF
mmetsp:Transcript_4269/g.17162  ORF Transcript_4269/g.17162 Transcript_4269/m.17162 type:complete len:94 (-) Transcript_4269:1159-1440(-)